MGKKPEMAVTPPRNERDEIAHLLGSQVVIDTPWSLIYVGTLTDWSDHFVTLEDVDAHDVAQGTTSKDTYAHNARKHGVQINRRSVMIRMSQVVSLSALNEVIEY